jgi:hypothetical protein
VKVGSEGSQIVHLHDGREWEHFNEWMKVHRPIDRWSASFKELWMNCLREISNGAAQMLETLGNDFGVEIRYLRNTLRVWFVPLFDSRPAFRRPLAEEPIPKDKWFTSSDLMAFSAPSLEQAQNEPTILFGPGHTLQERYPDPEVQGGKIALIAFEQNRVQKLPNDLDRMQSSLQRQIACNQRIMEAEAEIAGINSDLPRFLWGMRFTDEEQVIICANGSESMKRNEEQIAGQFGSKGTAKWPPPTRFLTAWPTRENQQFYQR